MFTCIQNVCKERQPCMTISVLRIPKVLWVHFLSWCVNRDRFYSFIFNNILLKWDFLKMQTMHTIKTLYCSTSKSALGSDSFSVILCGSRSSHLSGGNGGRGGEGLRKYENRLTFSATWRPGQLPGLSCRPCDLWRWRPDVCAPSASPCARRRSRGTSCAGLHPCRWTCDGPGGRAPIRICGSGTRASGTQPAVCASATGRCSNDGPTAGARRPLCQKRCTPISRTLKRNRNRHNYYHKVIVQ